VKFTQEQLNRAAHTDIKSFLEAKGEKVLKSGSEWMWASNHSLKIRGHVFYDHATGDTGTAINFLCEFFHMNFQGAVYTLLDDNYAGADLERSYNSQPERKPFILPKRNRNMQRVYAYLMQERHIDDEIITFFAHRRTLYESEGTHNCVFVGLDSSGKPRAAHEKGTLSERPYRRDVTGSEKDYFFNYCGGSDRLYVFEAPIDLMSFLCLNQTKNWQQHNYIALGGLSDRALARFLIEHPRIRKIVFCLDNDFDAQKRDGSPEENHGQVMAESYRRKYTGKGYETSILTPRLKDWNEIQKKQDNV
jgi:hypothetical protein